MGFGPLHDLARDVTLAQDVARDLDQVVTLLDLGDADLEAAVASWRLLVDAVRELGVSRDELASKIGEAMGEKRWTGTGITLERHRRTARVEWDRDALLSAVLDSRIVDTHTGEIKDETPLQKVLTVWNLPAPRITALRERDIDADQFCRREDRDGWTLREYAP